jgi:hypothetical protein
MVCCEGCGVKPCLAAASARQLVASAQAQEALQLLVFRQAVLRPRVHAFSRRPCMGARPSAATGRSARRERLKRGLHADGLATARAHEVPSVRELKGDGAAPAIYACCVKLSVDVRPAAATGRAARRARLKSNTNSNVCSNSHASGRLSFSRAFCITGRSCGLPTASAYLQR